MPMSALVAGGGGREFSVMQALLQSKSIGSAIWGPGNGGFHEHYQRNIKADDVTGIVKLARDEKIDFVFVGPEAPLVLGLVDKLDKIGILSFGPTEGAARLESSKRYAKDLLMEIGGPTPAYEWANDFNKAEQIIRSWGAPIVIKADGLCAGKGVKVALTLEEALLAAHQCLVDGIFGQAGRLIVIEKYTPGREFSLMCLCDGVNAIPLPVVRDYKRALSGDRGENTGGMGAYAQVRDVTSAHVTFVMQNVVLPTLREMERRGHPFKGCLYVGCVITPDGQILVYEFNVRFGDPETQVLAALAVSGFIEALVACSTYGGLANVASPGFSDEAVVNLVIAAPGYPGTPTLGAEILGLGEAGPVIHAGTRRQNGKFYVNGGRVLNVVRKGKTLADARAAAYGAAARLYIPGMQLRPDIAAEAMYT